MQTNIINRVILAVLFPFMSLTLAGCWTPPNARVQPAGVARLIQEGIATESVKDPATIESIDTGQLTVGLKLSDGTSITCKAGSKVKHFDQLKVGDKVKATVTEELAVYVLTNGQLTGADGKPQTINTSAKVQQVDPSYRLLTVQYADGSTETLKLGLDAEMQEMAPGDDVVVRPGEVTAIKIEN